MVLCSPFGFLVCFTQCCFLVYCFCVAYLIPCQGELVHGSSLLPLTTTSWPLPSPMSESQQGHWSRSLCILNSMKSHQVAPLKGCTGIYSHQQWIHGRSISSTPHQHFALSTFLNLPNLIGIRGISDSYCNLNVSDYQ